MARYIRFEESRPDAVREMLAEAPVAYVPFGSLEWHGEHNPLGLDGLKVEELLKRTADVTGGVLFPTVFWGAFNTMPFPFTFHFPCPALPMIAWKMLRQLRRDGFKVIVMLTGHYPPAFVAHLYLQARLFNRKAGAVAMAFPEMFFSYDLGYYGDHGAHWETSIMAALRPDLVDISAAPPPMGYLARSVRRGVIGKDPALFTDLSLGEEVVGRVVAGLSGLVVETLETGSKARYEAMWRRYKHQAYGTREGIRGQIGIV